MAYGAADVDLVTGTETPPNITQSETYSIANPDNPNEVLVAYNDSRGRNLSTINISAVSTSTDGGLTFTRLTCSTVAGSCTNVGQGPFAGTRGRPRYSVQQANRQVFHHLDRHGLRRWRYGRLLLQHPH